jgi:Mg-chelatase subunit ChlD
MVGMTAMTIDLGTMYIARTELQRSADAAVLGAVCKLAKYKSGAALANARDEAERIVEANPVNGKSMKLDLAKDVEFGQGLWDANLGKHVFVPGETASNAIRVTIRMTQGSPNGPLNLMFARVLGRSYADLSVRSAAMLAPRDTVFVNDTSSSMSSDSRLDKYGISPTNLWNIWVCLPIEKGNNGVGNGIDPPPPGNPPINDDYGTGPGDPGNRGGADPKTDPGLKGPTWGRLYNWGTLETTGYDPASDPGLEYLPYNATWNSITLANWLAAVGYNSRELNALLSSQFDDNGSGTGRWKYRVAVALGLARWDSGMKDGLWSTLPSGYTSSTKGNGNNILDAGELAWLVSFPYKDGSSKADMDYWMDYIDSYMGPLGTGTALYQADPAFQYRFGLKTFVNYLQERWLTNSQCADLAKTPQQPLQAVKTSVSDYITETLTSLGEDQASLVVYGTTASKEVGLTKKVDDVSTRLRQMQAAHYDGESNLGGAIKQAISELTSSRARPNATKAIFLLSGSEPNVTSTGSIGTVGGEQYVLDQIQAAINKRIRVYVISIGSNVDRALMQQIAAMTGTTEYYAGATIEEYTNSLPEILSELNLKRGPRLIE